MIEAESHRSPYGSPSTDPALKDTREVSGATIEMLQQTKGWVSFLAILGYVGCGMMALSGLILMLGMQSFKDDAFDDGALDFTQMGALYSVLAVLHLFPCLKLHKYARAITRLIESHDTIDLEAALNQQRSFWKFCGILAILMVALYTFIIIFAVIVGFTNSDLLPT